jgi:hypothetical protein
MARRQKKRAETPSIAREEWGFFAWASKEGRTLGEITQCWFHELTRELISRGMTVPEPLKVVVFGGGLPQRAFLDSDDNPRASSINPEFIVRLEMFADFHPARLAMPGQESKCNFPLNVDWNARTDVIIKRIEFLLRIRKKVMGANSYKGKKVMQRMQSDLKKLAAVRLMRFGMKINEAQEHAEETTGCPIYLDPSDWRRAGRQIEKLLDSMSKQEGQDILHQLEYLHATPIQEFWQGEQMIEIPVPSEK